MSHRVPVVAIAAHIPSKKVGGTYFPETHPRHPQFVARTVDEVAADHAMFVADTGQPGHAVPQAIGIESAPPGRQVVPLSGEGGLAMLIGERIDLAETHVALHFVAGATR